jgi:ABC-2 type transport system ATP-binding protein
MIDVSDLTKHYGAVEALKGVSFHVDSGEIIGLLGPNGAGKTTTMKILTGYLQPTSGTALIHGLDVLTHARQVQALIGYLPENAPLYPELSVQDYLQLMADLRQIPAEKQPAYLSDAVRATGLEQQLTRLIGQLSKGYRQRVGLAQAILHKPKLLILDEPTIGLDPTQIVEVRHLIGRLAQQSTVMLSTHILSEVEATCDRVVILLNGEIKADAQLAELEATTDIVLVLEEDRPEVSGELEGLPGVRAVDSAYTPDGYVYRIRTSNGPALSFSSDVTAEQPGSTVDLRPVIFGLAQAKHWPVNELRRDRRTLEAVFNELATTAGGQTT